MKRYVVDGLEVSCFCQGVMPFGTGVSGSDMHRLYDDFRLAGGNFFDTAHCYSFWLENGDGASERAIGECLRRSGDRQQVVIATKGCHPARMPKYPRPDFYIAPEIIASDVQDSLDRLGVDQIDLYYLHRDDPRLPVSEIVDALNAEVARGHLRSLGASNWSTARIEEANVYAAKRGLKGFAASQPQWNLANLNSSPDPTMVFVSPDDEAWHTRHQLPIIPYSPTACGYFAKEEGSLTGHAFDNLTSRQRHQRARELAAELDATPNQIALAWLMAQPFPVIPILGTTKRDHLADALGAAAIHLTSEQVQWLRNG